MQWDACTRTHKRTHAHACTRTRTNTHTHTHTCTYMHHTHIPPKHAPHIHTCTTHTHEPHTLPPTHMHHTYTHAPHTHVHTHMHIHACTHTRTLNATHIIPFLSYDISLSDTAPPVYCIYSGKFQLHHLNWVWENISTENFACDNMCGGHVALKYLPAVTQESLLPPAVRAEANSAVTSTQKQEKSRSLPMEVFHLYRYLHSHISRDCLTHDINNIKDV